MSQNNLGGPSHTFLRFLTKSGGIIFFSFKKSKTVISHYVSMIIVMVNLNENVILRSFATRTIYAVFGDFMDMEIFQLLDYGRNHDGVITRRGIVSIIHEKKNLGNHSHGIR